MKDTINNIKDWNLGIDCKTPVIIAGPCSIESEEQVLETARRIYLSNKDSVKIFRAGVWKPRTNPGCFEGLGLTAIPYLKKIKDEFGMKIAVEIPDALRLKELFTIYKDVVDIIWVGARTTGDVFAVQSIIDMMCEMHLENIPVLIKNPISPDIKLWEGAIERFTSNNINNIGLIFRGFKNFNETKYRNTPIWKLPLSIKKKYPNVCIFGDPSHIGGNRNYIKELSQISLDCGFEGLMIECHCNPEEAWTDASQQITPENLNTLLSELVFKDNHNDVELSVLRDEIDIIDREIIKLLADRMDVSRKIADFKEENCLKTYQPKRAKEVLETRKEFGKKMKLNENFIEDVYKRIMDESILMQDFVKLDLILNKNMTW